MMLVVLVLMGLVCGAVAGRNQVDVSSLVTKRADERADIGDFFYEKYRSPNWHCQNTEVSDGNDINQVRAACNQYESRGPRAAFFNNIPNKLKFKYGYFKNNDVEYEQIKADFADAVCRMIGVDGNQACDLDPCGWLNDGTCNLYQTGGRCLWLTQAVISSGAYASHGVPEDATPGCYPNFCNNGARSSAASCPAQVEQQQETAFTCSDDRFPDAGCQQDVSDRKMWSKTHRSNSNCQNVNAQKVRPQNIWKIKKRGGCQMAANHDEALINLVSDFASYETNPFFRRNKRMLQEDDDGIQKLTNSLEARFSGRDKAFQSKYVARHENLAVANAIEVVRKIRSPCDYITTENECESHESGSCYFQNGSCKSCYAIRTNAGGEGCDSCENSGRCVFFNFPQLETGYCGTCSYLKKDACMNHPKCGLFVNGVCTSRPPKEDPPEVDPDPDSMAQVYIAEIEQQEVELFYSKYALERINGEKLSLPLHVFDNNCTNEYFVYSCFDHKYYYGYDAEFEDFKSNVLNVDGSFENVKESCIKWRAESQIKSHTTWEPYKVPVIIPADGTQIAMTKITVQIVPIIDPDEDDCNPTPNHTIIEVWHNETYNYTVFTCDKDPETKRGDHLILTDSYTLGDLQQGFIGKPFCDSVETHHIAVTNDFQYWDYNLLWTNGFRSGFLKKHTCFQKLSYPDDTICHIYN